MKYYPVFSDLQFSSFSFWIVPSSSILAEVRKITCLEIFFTPSFYSCLWWWCWWCHFFVALFKILKLWMKLFFRTHSWFSF